MNLSKKNCGLLFIFFVFTSISISAQGWTMKFNSVVEKDDKVLAGATIAVYNGASLFNQVQSGSKGEFVIDVPGNGDYMLVISYPGCSSKKIQISTTDVPDEISKDNSKLGIGFKSFSLSKPLKGIDYSFLEKPLIKIAYLASRKNFMDDKTYTDQTLIALGKIKEQESALLEKFESALKSGDEALTKTDCATAQSFYEKAAALIPDEQKANNKLLSAEKCKKDKEIAEKKAAEKKALADKAAADKAEQDKITQEKIAAEKVISDKKALEKTEVERIAKENAAKDKAEQERIAKEKAIAESATAERITAERVETERIAKENSAKDKADQDRIAKDKAIAEKAITEKAAAEKAETERIAKENSAKDKAEQDRIAKDKAIADKAIAEKSAAEKAETERIAKENLAKDKLIADKALTQKTETDKNATPGSTTQSAETINEEPFEKERGNAKYSIPQVIGKNMYKELICKGDDYFKTKRYKEAEIAYEDALKLKNGDTYAAKKLADVERILNPRYIK